MENDSKVGVVGGNSDGEATQCERGEWGHVDVALRTAEDDQFRFVCPEANAIVLTPVVQDGQGFLEVDHVEVKVEPLFHD